MDQQAQLDAGITATLAYADLFGAGLSEPELLQRLFVSSPVGADAVRRRLGALNGASGVVARSGGRYHLAAGSPPALRPDVPDLAGPRAWAR